MDPSPSSTAIHSSIFLGPPHMRALYTQSSVVDLIRGVLASPTQRNNAIMPEMKVITTQIYFDIWQPTSLCAAVSPLALDCNTYHRFTRSSLVCTTRGNETAALFSHAGLLACAVTPGPNFPLKTALRSSTN